PSPPAPVPSLGLAFLRRSQSSTPFPYTTLFRSVVDQDVNALVVLQRRGHQIVDIEAFCNIARVKDCLAAGSLDPVGNLRPEVVRSEEHTSELQSRENLVCRLLLEKKKMNAAIAD